MDEQHIEHEAAGRPSEQMTDAEVLAALAYCARCWESGVRLLANLRAGDIARALSSQEEELRKVRDELRSMLLERRAAETASCQGYEAAVARAEAAEAEVRSLREERDALSAQIRHVGIVPYLDRMKELAEARDEALALTRRPEPASHPRAQVCAHHGCQVLPEHRHAAMVSENTAEEQ